MNEEINNHKIQATESNETTECDETMVELKKIYWYERQLLIAIPMLLKTAKSKELVDSLTVLTNYTKEHINSLENKFPFITRQ